MDKHFVVITLLLTIAWVVAVVGVMYWSVK
jgi:hypothetical protein